MISLCLQCYPGDMDAAMELAELICDLEFHRREETEFFLVYRKDCPYQLKKTFDTNVSQKFGRAEARMARNHDVGWPGGSNMLAACAMIEMAILKREGICRNEAFLLFEPDCIPCSIDWLDRLTHEWEHTKTMKKESFGHWHQAGDTSTLHQNGNAVFRADFYDKYPTMIVGPALQGWDYWFRDRILEISRDSNLVFQNYNRFGLTEEEFEQISKNGVRPAVFHGVKTADGRLNARNSMLKAVS